MHRDTTGDDTEIEYQLEHNTVQKTITRWKNWNIRRHCVGAVIDLGCGIGSLLSTLPSGSLGLDVNRRSIEFCRAAGLNVRHYDKKTDQFQLKDIAPNKFRTLVISHTLGYMERPVESLDSLLSAGVRIGLKRVVVVVPGEKGFRSGLSKKTFIDETFFHENGFFSRDDWNAVEKYYFPFNMWLMGKLFPNNEMVVVFSREPHLASQAV